jgi:hypothetical protein
MLSSLLLLFCAAIIGMSIYNIATQPHNKPEDWLVPVGGILGGLLGIYASVKLFPREAGFMSARYASLARLTK